MIHILYTHYFDRLGKNLSVGGIQTYIYSLANILVQQNYKVIIYQSADINFNKKIGGITVKGYKSTLKEAKTLLLKECKKNLNQDDIVIFGTDTLAAPVSVHSIAIQHGVSWDIPDKSASFLFLYLKKAYKAWMRIKTVSCVDQLVCVDYNFINWIRSISPYCDTEMIAVPNFTKVPKEMPQKKKEDHINIVFARRFFWYRGTKVFTEAIERILQERNNVFVTFAGEGEDEEFLKTTFKKYPNVEFIRYDSQDALNIHTNKHIAVVPTVGSEGTSLSLLEAMASGCAVVCTNVGGMTNIVLDGFNGSMVSAGDSKQLHDAILKLIDDEKFRKRIAANGFKTAKEAFSYEKWCESWIDIINGIKNN